MRVSTSLVVFSWCAAVASGLRPGAAPRRRSVARDLFGGVPEKKPPPASSIPSPGPKGGEDGGMTIPGLGQISEDEMKLAMEHGRRVSFRDLLAHSSFRQKLAEKMAAAQVEGSALGGKVKVIYDGQGQPVKVDISDEALKEGEAAVAAAVTDAAKKAQIESLTKMKQMMMSMQAEIAQTLKDGGSP